jgi:hypothetical protein
VNLDQASISRLRQRHGKCLWDWIEINDLNMIFNWRLSLRICQNLPPQRGSENSLNSAVSKYPHEAMFASAVFEKFAALLDKNLLLLCATALVLEPAKSAVTCQEMNVSAS